MPEEGRTFRAAGQQPPAGLARIERDARELHVGSGSAGQTPAGAQARAIGPELGRLIACFTTAQHLAKGTLDYRGGLWQVPHEGARVAEPELEWHLASRKVP